MSIDSVILDPMLRLLSSKRASVFVFHSLPADVRDPVTGRFYADQFELVLDVVQDKFDIVPLSEILARLKTGLSIGGLLSITFDDGYVDWPDTVCPILTKRKLPATFFITTSQLAGVPLWSERVSEVVERSRGPQLQVPHPAIGSVDVSSAERRRETTERLTNFLKYFKVPFRDALISKMEDELGGRFPSSKVFGVSHLRSVAKQGFDIGSHTVNHPILSYCSEQEALYEIAKCREDLQELIGADVSHFAYPNGKPMADFSGRDIELSKRAGYTGAVTTAFGTVLPDTSPYQVPRFTPWGSSHIQMSRQIAGNLLKTGEQISEEITGKTAATS